MYSILTYINTHLILIQDEPELGEVFTAVVILMRSWNEMTDKITMVQQKLSNAADDKELGCMMCHVLTTGKILGIFSFNPRKLKQTSGWSAESCFKSGRKNSITVLFLSRFIHFTSWHWYQMLYWITCVFYCSRRFFFQQHKPNQLIPK